jgi:hypothetical protein
MYDQYLFSMIISSYMRPLWYTMYEIEKQALYRTMSPRTNCLEKHTTLVLYEYIVIWRVDSQSLCQTSAHSIIQLSFGVKTRLHGCHPLHLDLQTCTSSALLYLVEKNMVPFTLQYISINVTNPRFAHNFLGKPWILHIYVSLPKGISPFVRHSHLFSGTMSQDSQAKDRHWFCTFSAVSCGKLGLLPSGNLTVCYGTWPVYRWFSSYST